MVVAHAFQMSGINKQHVAPILQLTQPKQHW